MIKGFPYSREEKDPNHAQVAPMCKAILSLVSEPHKRTEQFVVITDLPQGGNQHILINDNTEGKRYYCNFGYRNQLCEYKVDDLNFKAFYPEKQHAKSNDPVTKIQGLTPAYASTCAKSSQPETEYVNPYALKKDYELANCVHAASADINAIAEEAIKRAVENQNKSWIVNNVIGAVSDPLLKEDIKKKFEECLKKTFPKPT